MTTVDDIIGESMTLKERAKAAHLARQEAEAVDHAAQFNGLIADTLGFLCEEFSIPEGDLSTIEFKAAPRENNFAVAKFRYSGIWFRSSYAKETINVSTHTKVDHVILRMQVTNAQMLNSATSWTKIESLADLGKVLI